MIWVLIGFICASVSVASIACCANDEPYIKLIAFVKSLYWRFKAYKVGSCVLIPERDEITTITKTRYSKYNGQPVYRLGNYLERHHEDTILINDQEVLFKALLRNQITEKTYEQTLNRMRRKK